MKGAYPLIIYDCITELRSVLSYLGKSATFLSEEQKEFQDRLENKVKECEMNEEQATSFYDAKYEKIQEIHSFFPIALRSSVLIFAFSLFESRLVEACKYLDQNSFAKTISWAEIKELKRYKGSHLKKAAGFLKKNFMIYPEDNKKWDLILQFYKVRNCFVHANGDLNLMKPGQKDKLEKALPALSRFGVKLSDIEKLEIGDFAVSSAVEAMKKWVQAFLVASRENAILGPHFWP